MDDIQGKATKMVNYFLSKKLYSKKDAAKLIGISRTVMYTRLANSDWRKPEVDAIFDNFKI